MKTIINALKKLNSQPPEVKKIASVLSAGLNAADPYQAVWNVLNLNGDILTVRGERYILPRDGKIIVVSLGKAAPAMTAAVLDRLLQRVERCVCICKHHDPNLEKYSNISIQLGNHPVPGEGSLAAGHLIQKAVSGLTCKDIVVLLISGGGSSLVASPVDDVSLADLQLLTTTLLRSGASINELNTVRKHLEQLKGGGILQLATPARVIGLILSDVVGDPLDVIASGPTVPDISTFKEALDIVVRARENGPIPETVIKYLEKGIQGKVPETLKPIDPINQLAHNIIVGSNIASCKAACKKATDLGIRASIVSTKLVGEARSAGEYLARNAAKLHMESQPQILIFGGETTVMVNGNGLGGRNLETALGAVKELAGLKETYLLTFATDGEDGSTDAAGAIVTGSTLHRAEQAGMDVDTYLDNNDSYHFFKTLGDLIIIEPTGTNVNDLSMIFRL